MLKGLLKESFLYIVVAVVAATAALIFMRQNEFKPEIQYGDYSKYGVSEAHSIIVYGADYCPACKQLRLVLKEKEIEYKYFELENQPEAFEVLRENGIKGMPVLLVNHSMVIGFSEYLTDKILIENNVVPSE